VEDERASSESERQELNFLLCLCRVHAAAHSVNRMNRFCCVLKIHFRDCCVLFHSHFIVCEIFNVKIIKCNLIYIHSQLLQVPKLSFMTNQQQQQKYKINFLLLSYSHENEIVAISFTLPVEKWVNKEQKKTNKKPIRWWRLNHTYERAIDWNFYHLSMIT
jgi:hypothetical protein